MKTAKKIKILNTIGWLGHGGMEGGVLKLLNGMDRSRFTPFLVATRGYDENVKHNLAEDVGFSAFKKKEGRDWSIVKQISRYITQNKIDLVHSHNWETFLYSFLAARLAGVAVFIHGEHGRDTENVEEGWAKRNAMKFLAAHSNRLTTVSQDIADMMVERWRVSPNKIDIIPNGLDLSRFHPPADRSQAKRRLGFSEKSFIIGTVIGTFRPVKDLPTLLAAFAKVKMNHPECELLIVGGPKKSQLPSNGYKSYFEAEAIIDVKTRNAIHFCGPQQDTAKYMQSCDIYANSSVYEGMSNTLLEAMGCGAAIVATKVGGTPFIIRHGYNGLLVPSASPEAMSQAILRMLEEPLLREELTSNGLEYVKAKHRLDLFVAKHERIYQEEYLRKRPNATLANVSVRAVLESEFEN